MVALRKMKLSLHVFCVSTFLSTTAFGLPFGINWLGLEKHFLTTKATFQQHPKAVQSDCGRQLVRKSKIVNGESAYFGEFPWMVSLQHRNGHFCGGALIDNYWVLTAAHCFVDTKRNQDKDGYRVVAGTLNLTNQDTNVKVTTKIAKIVVHEHFSSTVFINDIALIKLTDPIIWDDYKQPICLPNEGSHIVDNEDVVVTGWGWDKEPGDGGKMVDTLQKVKVKVVERDDCANWFRQAGHPYSFQNGHLCAGFKEGGKDSCVGDSGGAMFVKRNDRFQVVGIVSSGIGCARPLLPGLYTDVEIYLPWIASKMN